MNTPAPRPPIVHTHRKPGKPVTDGPRLPRLDAKHRGEPRPENIPPWVHMLQAHADRAERSRDAHMAGKKDN